MTSQLPSVFRKHAIYQNGKKCKFCKRAPEVRWAGMALSVQRLVRYRPDGLAFKHQVVARISAPSHTDPGTHPPSYTTGAGSFPGVKRPGRGVDHKPPSSGEVKERV